MGLRFFYVIFMVRAGLNLKRIWDLVPRQRRWAAWAGNVTTDGRIVLEPVQQATPAAARVAHG